MVNNLTIVVGGQAGSEGKGAVVGRLHKERRYDVAVRVGGPNAGHTIVDDDGRAWPLRQIPVAAVADPGCRLVIAAGSEIDEEVLQSEVDSLDAAGYNVTGRLTIDKTATLIEPYHKASESTISTGTTAKGIGGARAARAMRNAKLYDGLFAADTQYHTQRALVNGERVMIEGTQGHWLGSHAGFYPHCTSGDCRASDFLAAVGLPPMDAEVWVVLRTHPIRIAGKSGPLPGETTWDELGLEPEFTTVTKKMRRVGSWDWEWAEASVRANRRPGTIPPVALTFADYWWPELKGANGAVSRASLPDDVRAKLYEIDIRLGCEVRLLGTGPDTQLLTEGE